jgi:uncharacterized protein YjiS (DUF1127 family)
MYRAKILTGVAPGLLGRLTGRFRDHFAHSRTRESLSALDDHMLRDLGIQRSEIDDVIKGGRRS